jgi:hypothetical protein
MLSTDKNVIPPSLNKKMRVDYMLERRLTLLKEVKEIADLTDYYVFNEYTCERAMIFFNNHLKSLWQDYVNKGQNEITEAKDHANYYK